MAFLRYVPLLRREVLMTCSAIRRFGNCSALVHRTCTTTCSSSYTYNCICVPLLCGAQVSGVSPYALDYRATLAGAVLVASGTTFPVTAGSMLSVPLAGAQLQLSPQTIYGYSWPSDPSMQAR